MPRSLYPPQVQKLLGLIAGIIAGRPDQAFAGLDASALVQLRKNRLAPWLYLELAQKGWEKYCPDPAFMQELRRDYLFSWTTVSRQQEMILRVIHELSLQGIELILLKGADLRLRLYRDPAARPMDDLDLLIDPKSLPLAKSRLAQMGFRLSKKYLDLTPGYWEVLGEALHYLPPGGEKFNLDLHWEIGGVWYFYRIPYSELNQNTQQIFIDEMPVHLLSPENLIILLCLNAYKEHTNPIVGQVLDLLLCLTSFSMNWRTVTDRAAIFKCQRPVFAMLREIARLVPNLVPPEVLEELAKYQPSLAELMMLHGKWRYLTLGLPSFYRHRSLRDWLMTVKATIWPDAGYLTAVYGQPDRLAYFRDLWEKLYPKD